MTYLSYISKKGIIFIKSTTDTNKGFSVFILMKVVCVKMWAENVREDQIGDQEWAI